LQHSLGFDPFNGFAMTMRFAICLMFALFSFAAIARADSALSTASAAPIGSVIETASAVADAVVELPIALSVDGSTLAVTAVTASADGTVYLLERVSDGAKVGVEVVGALAEGVSVAAGTTVSVTVVAAGTILSVAGSVIALIPSAVGDALLHHEQISE
jgi:hypothetical protein